MKSLIKILTCFEYLENITSVVLMLKNSNQDRQGSCTINTELLRFRKMMITVLK